MSLFLLLALQAVGQAPTQQPEDVKVLSVTVPNQANSSQQKPSVNPDETPSVNAATSSSSPAVVGALALTCMGAGTANKVRGASVYGSHGWATIAAHHDRAFSDQVDVRLFDGDDRIRLPRTMLPGLHGGNDGWFKLKNVVADAREIHAEAGVNFINHPKIYIDRVTGTISISGKAGDYAGQCEVVAPDAPAKF